MCTELLPGSLFHVNPRHLVVFQTCRKVSIFPLHPQDLARKARSDVSSVGTISARCCDCPNLRVVIAHSACLQPPFRALQRLIGPRQGPGGQGSKAVLMGQRPGEEMASLTLEREHQRRPQTWDQMAPFSTSHDLHQGKDPGGMARGFSQAATKQLQPWHRHTLSISSRSQQESTNSTTRR